jgi:uncharacterized protein (DUF58 family)
MRIILIFLIVLILYWLQESIYVRNCFKKFSSSIDFNIHGVFEGETVKLKCVLMNAKLIPLWWLGIKYNLSRYLIFNEDINENEGNDNFRKDMFFVGSYEKVTKIYDIKASKRGYYDIWEMEQTTGDIFGNLRVINTIPCHAELYVYPRLIDTMELNIAFNKMNGEILAKRHIVEDPFQLRGIREYHPFDSMKLVNWNATARSGELKVNQYDYTASGEVTMLLNIERYNSWDPEKIIEESISLCASLCTQYLELGMNVEILSNGCDITTDEPIEVGDGSNFNHNIHIYENLAKLNINKLKGPIAEVIEDKLDATRKNKVIILISHYFGESVENAVREAKLKGYDLKWIIPKEPNTKVTVDNLKDLFIWEVKNL